MQQCNNLVFFPAADNCQSKNEFIEKAVNFYVDYLGIQDNTTLLHYKTEEGELRTMPGIKNLVRYQQNLAADEAVAFWGYVFLLWERLLVGKGYSSAARGYGCL